VLSGRFAATVDDVKALARPVLRHRVLPNFTAESEGLTSVKLIDLIVERVTA
jgi:MoxR-like ATPase